MSSVIHETPTQLDLRARLLILYAYRGFTPSTHPRDPKYVEYIA
jgi:hypothetical protein